VFSKLLNLKTHVRFNTLVLYVEMQLIVYQQFDTASIYEVPIS